MTETTPSPTDEQRRVRLELCRTAAAFDKAIGEIGDMSGIKGELSNSVTLTLRMALRLNDGHMSAPDRMRSW